MACKEHRFRSEPRKSLTLEDTIKTAEKQHSRGQESPAGCACLSEVSLSTVSLSPPLHELGWLRTCCIAHLGFLSQRFYRLFATRPVCSETNKQFGSQVLTMVLLFARGFWFHAVGQTTTPRSDSRIGIRLSRSAHLSRIPPGKHVEVPFACTIFWAYGRQLGSNPELAHPIDPVLCLDPLYFAAFGRLRYFS